MPPPELSEQFSTFGRLRVWLAEESGGSRRYLWATGLGALLVLIVSVALLTFAWKQRANDDARSRLLEARRLAGSAAGQAVRMEAAHRAFLLTRQPRDLEPFTSARTEMQRSLSELSAALDEDISAANQVRQIRQQFEAWLQGAALPLVAGDSSQTGSTSRSKLAFDTVRSSLDDLLRNLDASLDAAMARGRFQHLLLMAGLCALAALAVGLPAFSSFGNYRMFRTHLRKAETALAQTHSIIASTLDGVVIIDDQGRILSVNPAVEKMFAQPAAKVIGRNISMLIPQRLFAHDLATVGRGSLIAVGQRQGYYSFPIEISLSEIQVDGRRQFCALIRDVSERKRGEEILKHIGLGVSAATGEEFVRSLLKQLSKALDNDLTFLVELTGKDDSAPGLLTIAEKGELRSPAHLDLTHTICAEVVAQGFRAYPRNARQNFPEDALLGECNAEAFVGTPLVDHRGQTIGVMGILDRQPLTETGIIESTLQIFAARAAAEIERKRSEEALAAEKERLSVTLRSIGDGCVSLDNNGCVLMMNPVAEQLTGWPQDNAIGHPVGEVLQLLDERTRRRCQHVLQRMAQQGDLGGTSAPAILVARDGSERLVESNSSAIRDRAGRKLGVVLVFRDVTERHRLAEERQKAEKIESLGVVAGGIAHDFNNILTAILGNITLALGADPDEVVTERLSAARKATQRAQELAGQLLTFAKGGAPIKQTTNLGQLLRDTVACALPDAKSTCDFQIPDDLWPVDVDPGQLAQVIANIAVNADQAMPAGGTLRISAENVMLPTDSVSLGLRAGRWVRFSVHDQGIGIPEPYLKKIFDPYFTTKPKGSGLGLATAYSVVKNHQGTLVAESPPGAGSTFTVCLSASDKPLTAAAQPVTPPPAGCGRILVLDDEEDICMLVTCALEPLGYEVTETQDALTAISKYQDSMREGRKFDLVISDLTIPGGMGGREAIRRLRELDPEVRAIVSSGYANDPVMSRFEEFGFSGMIAKPYEIDALGRKVAEVLGQGTRARVVYHDFEERKSA